MSLLDRSYMFHDTVDRSSGGAAGSPAISYLGEGNGRLTRTILAIVLWALLAVAAGCGSDASLPPTATAPAAVVQSPTPQLQTASPTDTPSPTATAVPSNTPTPTATSARATAATASPTSRTLATITSTATPVATLQPTPTATATIVPPNFSGENALGYVRGLAADIGSRPSQSPESQQAAEYIQRQLSLLGYSATIEPYTFTQFLDYQSDLLIKQPELVEIVARGFVYTNTGTVEGELVYCGFGRPSDFPKAKLPGQIALIERGGGLTFQDKVANATARDVAGVIIYNDRDGEFQGSLTRRATVPVVGIQQQDGKYLNELIGHGPVVVSLTVEAQTESLSGSNVVALMKGTGSGKKVVVGAHYDSVSAGPGANDNASGIGTLLELANTVRGRRYPFDIVFVAFGDEEIGLIGSKKYVESLTQQERSQIIAMVNLDMVGVGDHLEIGGEKGLADRTLKIAQHLGYDARQMTLRLGTSSDHASFIEAQIPAVFIHRVEDPFYHTDNDVAENIAAGHLEVAGKIAYYLIEELARGN